MDIIVTSKDYTYRERQAVIDFLCEKYKFLYSFTIGKSCLGKNITALKIGNSKSYSLITAATHGSERITSNVLLMFVEDLCKAITSDKSIEGVNVRKGLYGRGVIFIPCVNPDGCDISLLGKSACGKKANVYSNLCDGNFKKWNANARGVDINHNFDASWQELRKKEISLGIIGPGPTRYGGVCPNSEPETKALVDLCEKTYIRHVVSTVEIGKGENPLPTSETFKIYKQIRELLILSTIM